MDYNRKREIVNRFGLFFITYNMSEIMGRILGLLLLSVNPLNLDNITQSLELSKASISIQIRKLVEIGYLRKLPKTKDRKDYYSFNEEFIRSTMLNYVDSKEKNQRSFIDLLSDFKESEADSFRLDEYKLITKRLDQIYEFNDLFINIMKLTLTTLRENEKGGPFRG